MLGRDFDDEVWLRFVFELVIWPNRLLWKDELNPRVRCAFGNVFKSSLSGSMWDICRKECIPIWCKQSNADHAPPNFPSPDWIPPTLLFPNHTVPFHRPLFFPTSCRLPQRTRPLPPTLCQSTNYHKASKTIRCQHNLVHSSTASTKQHKLAETRGD